MSLAGRDLISLKDLSLDEISHILDVADDMAEAIGFGGGERTPCERLDLILATMFYEPSTRTRLSFEAAMCRLGGQVLGFSGPEATSVMKGETLADTARMVEGYGDIIVIRHPHAGAARVVADYANVPVVNGGDGPHEHPTQTLTDLFCLRRRHGRLSGLRVGLCGDLRYGRTVHSLAPVMARFDSEIVCIAPEQLRMPQGVLAECEGISGRRPAEVAAIEDVLPSLDMLYMTRVQRERFESDAEYNEVKDAYELTAEMLRQATEHMIVMHPLPRINEISTDVDPDRRAAYFEQAAGGVPVRMAVIAGLLGVVDGRGPQGSMGLGAPLMARLAEPSGGPDGGKERRSAKREVFGRSRICTSGRCITNTEAYLEPAYVTTETGEQRCWYCEQAVNLGGLFEGARG